MRNSRKKKDSTLIKPDQSTLKSSQTRKASTPTSTPSSFRSKDTMLNSSYSNGNDNLTTADLSTLQLDENYHRNSNNSDDTEYTSITEVRDRPSSATVLKSVITQNYL